MNKAEQECARLWKAEQGCARLCNPGRQAGWLTIPVRGKQWETHCPLWGCLRDMQTLGLKLAGAQELSVHSLCPAAAVWTGPPLEDLSRSGNSWNRFLGDKGGRRAPDSSVPGGDAFRNNLFCVPDTVLPIGAREPLPSWMLLSSEDTTDTDKHKATQGVACSCVLGFKREACAVGGLRGGPAWKKCHFR